MASLPDSVASIEGTVLRLAREFQEEESLNWACKSIRAGHVWTGERRAGNWHAAYRDDRDTGESSQQCDFDCGPDPRVSAIWSVDLRTGQRPTTHRTNRPDRPKHRTPFTNLFDRLLASPGASIDDPCRPVIPIHVDQGFRQLTRQLGVTEGALKRNDRYSIGLCRRSPARAIEDRVRRLGQVRSCLGVLTSPA